MGAEGVTIIKRKKVIAGVGHHVGAWNVAYADFVTAMMAFFLLMWLLNATTEKQRKGIADYFSPTIPVSKVSSGGNGAFSGESVFTEETQAHDGTGATKKDPSIANQTITGDVVSGRAENTEQDPQGNEFASIESALSGTSGESDLENELLQHIVTRVTDEGLIVEIFDLDNSPLFYAGTADPSEKLIALLKMMSKVFNLVENGIAISGHISSLPLVVRNNNNWQITSDRAQKTRLLLTEFGISDSRFERVTGLADRSPAASNLMASRNRRIELTLLRKKAETN